MAAQLTHKFDCGCKLEVIVRYEQGGHLYFGGGSLEYCEQHFINADYISSLRSKILDLEVENERLKWDITGLLERLGTERAKRFTMEDFLTTQRERLGVTV